MENDRPLLGIALMIGFVALAPMGDAVAKLLGQSVPLMMMLIVRFGVQAVALTPVVMRTPARWRMSRRVFGLVVLRTVLHIVGIGAMFTALQYLPLADAVAITFVMPFILLVLGHVLLGEEVGHRRLIACVVGFVGTLLIIKPSFAEVGLPALWPLVVAVVFSGFMLLTRHIRRETDPVGLQAVSGGLALILLVPFVIWGMVSGYEPFTLVAASAYDWSLLLVIGLMGTFAHLLMTWALRYAQSATLAPMQYLEIPFATIMGLVIFGDFPDGLAMLGIAITMVAGVFIVLREQASQKARLKASEPPLPAIAPAE